MASIKLVAWNVRGLRAKPKRLAVLSHLKQMRADISILAETHITGQLQLALKKPWMGWIYQAPYTNNSRGVAIIIAKTVQFQLHNLRSDQQGRYLFLHATVGGLEVLLLAFYIPPPFQFTALKDGLAFMAQYPAYGLVTLIWSLTPPLIDTTHQVKHPPTPRQLGLGDFFGSLH